MASKLLVSEEEFTCPVCHDSDKDPVSMSCQHSICKPCLQQFWTTEGSLDCPVCRAKNSNGPAANQSPSEANVQERDQRCSPGSEGLCSLHSEKVKIFCLEDKQLICATCQVSKNHEGHNFCPIHQAACDFKRELTTVQESLKRKLKMLKDVKSTCDKTTPHREIQIQHAEMKIREEFEELQQFLRDEQIARIAELKKEEEQRNQTVKEKTEEMSREISSLSDTLRVIEEELEAEDITFLQNFSATLKRAQCTLQDPEMVSGALINVAKHLGNLKFRVWEKMQEIVQYTPVILDPNTAGPRVLPSEDLTSVKFSDEFQQHPDNPERFDCLYPCVVSYEGFNSGTHCWDVDVEDNTYWELGVITQSVQRNDSAAYMNGLWCVLYSNDKYKIHSPDQSWTHLTINQKLKRIRVELDWDRGNVSFSDPLNNTHLHVFAHTFTETVFPYFCNYCKFSPLRILPVKPSVTVEQND